MVSVKKVYTWCLLCILFTNTILAKKENRKTRNGNHIKHKIKKLHPKVSDTEQPPTVQLNNGMKIIGTTNATIGKQKPYYSFRKIPYAVPPLGNLRFRAPQPLASNFSNTTIYATENASPCLQSMILPTSVIGSEDCLYINVYSPQVSQRNSSLLPVMVWIYGGAFTLGESTYTIYGPDYLLEEDVVIVTFNYRVGIFGFLSTEDDASPGNYGLKDQILALKWVNENIKSFGGNPQQVTIFGESAGSASVSYLSQTPLTKGLIHGAILESGTSLCLWALTRQPLSVAKTTALALGIYSSNSEKLVEALRKVPHNKLQVVEAVTFYEKLLKNNDLNSLPFGPTLEPDRDDAVIVNKSYQQLQNGLYHHVPYIIGFNSLEAIPIVEVINFIRWYLLRYDLIPTALVPASLNINDDAIERQVNRIIKSYYFELIPVTIAQQQLLEYISDDQFVRPILQAVLLYSQNASVYLYRFSYEGRLGSSRRIYKGVGHAEEVAYLWRTEQNNVEPTASDIVTRQRMVRLWTNFAKTGNPTLSEDPLLGNVKWPTATTAGIGNLSYLDIGNNLTTGINPNWKNFMFWQDVFNNYGNPPYSTY